MKKDQKMFILGTMFSVLAVIAGIVAVCTNIAQHLYGVLDGILNKVSFEK